MNDILIKFIKKLDTLPEEVKLFHSGNISNNYINKLSEKYQVDKDSIFNAMTEIIAEDFDFGILEKYNFNIEYENLLKTDIIGYLFLPIDRYLKDVDVESEIKKRDGDILAYGINISELVDAAENEKDNIIDTTISNFDKMINNKEEKTAVFDFIGSDLVTLLTDDTDALNGINATLINLLFNDKNFKEEITQSLFMNGEMLTHEQFEMDSKTQSPTIGNWIQDFIKVYGSGMFNNLALTKYVTESKNAKCLSSEEKKLVQKLLQLYRNLKFFPESLRDTPMEEWEIIPVKKEKEVIGQTRKIWGPPKTEEEKKIAELRRDEEQFSEGGLERLAIEEEIDNKKKLESLKIEANKYIEGSLERMAVEEEIRKLGA